MRGGAASRTISARHRLGNTQTDDLWQRGRGGGRQAGHRHRPRFHAPARRAADPGRERDLPRRQDRRRPPPGRVQPRPSGQARRCAWRVPVIASTVGGARGAHPGRGRRGAGSAVPGCGPLVVNSGQTGYYRTLYTPALLDRLTASFARLRPIDQIGLLADNWGARPRRLPVAPPRRSTWSTRCRPTPIRRLLDPGRRPSSSQRPRHVRGRSRRTRRCSPATPRRSCRRCSRRIGWTPKAGEAPTTPVLRAELIATLGEMGDPAVVAEANRRFAANDPLATAGPLREHHPRASSPAMSTPPAGSGCGRRRGPSAARWSRSQLYRLLGSARDPALARRALDLALTDEPGATNPAPASSPRSPTSIPTSPSISRSRNRERVEALVDVSSRSRYLAGLGRAARPTRR